MNSEVSRSPNRAPANKSDRSVPSTSVTDHSGHIGTLCAEGVFGAGDASSLGTHALSRRPAFQSSRLAADVKSQLKLTHSVLGVADSDHQSVDSGG
jgi:hypothetical protein